MMTAIAWPHLGQGFWKCSLALDQVKQFSGLSFERKQRGFLLLALDVSLPLMCPVAQQFVCLFVFLSSCFG